MYNKDYISLLKKILTNSIYEPNTQTLTEQDILRCTEIYNKIQNETPHVLAVYPYITPRELANIFISTRRSRNIHTYVPMVGLDNVEECLLNIYRDGVPGHVMDAGTLRGGMAILMRGVIKALNDESRHVYVADSFEGLPPPGDKDSIMDHEVWYKFKDEAPEYYLDCKYSLDDVQRNFGAYNLLDERVIFLKGWFHETLPQLNDEIFSLIRLDADWHDSCRAVLDNIYPRLAVGGYVIVDDYNLQGCRSAIDEYRREHAIKDELQVADQRSGIIYWRKTSDATSARDSVD